MRTKPFSELITLSIDRTKEILFSPFDVKKWLRLILIAYLAGGLTGGGCNGNFGEIFDKEKQKEALAVVETPAEAQEQESLFTDDFGGDLTEASSQPADPAFGTPSGSTDQGPSWLAEIFGENSDWRKIATFLIIAFVLIGLPLMVLFQWLYSRFSFIWFDALTTNEVLIVAPFKKYRAEGNSYFRFLMILFVFGLVFFFFIGGWALFNLYSAGAFQDGYEWTFARGMQMLGAPLLGYIIITIPVCLVYFFITQFVVPVMALERCSFAEGWNRFVKVYNGNAGDFWLYFLVNIGLGIAVIVIAGVAAIIFLTAVLLLSGIIFGLMYWLFVALMKLQILFWILAVVIGVPLFVFVNVASMAINLPFAIFCRCFSLYFLSSLNCGYTPLSLPGEEGADVRDEDLPGQDQ